MIMKRMVFVICVFFMLIAGVQAGNKADTGIWIDVRTVAEYQQGYKAGAINIPHAVIGSRITEITSDKNTKIHLYCAAGARAGKAKAILERMGYSNVTNEGGLSDVR